jgi:RNA polymerase sigma-70 factor (ECF subfamily)
LQHRHAASTPLAEEPGPARIAESPTTLASDLVTPPAATHAPALPHPELVAAIPRLRRYARVLTGDATRADDLVQDTLARAWEKRRLWRTGSDLRAWLFTIMHNVHVNQLALARRDAANVSIDADPGNAAWQLPVRATQLDRIELLELAQQIGRLSSDQREVLLLAAVEELRYDEIASILSVPIGTVMSRLSRARDKLRQLLAEPTSALRVVK